MPPSYKMDIAPHAPPPAEVSELVAGSPEGEVPFGVRESVSDIVDRLTDQRIVEVLEGEGHAGALDETLEVPGDVEARASDCLQHENAGAHALLAQLDNEPRPHRQELRGDGPLGGEGDGEDLARGHDGNNGLNWIRWVTRRRQSRHTHVRHAVHPHPPVRPRLPPDPAHRVVPVLPLVLDREEVPAAVESPPRILNHVVEAPLQVQHCYWILPLASIRRSNEHGGPRLLGAAWGGKSRVQLRRAVAHGDLDAPEYGLFVALHGREVIKEGCLVAKPPVEPGGEGSGELGDDGDHLL
mmetsp:Transcript_8094/g.18858  ORF Transcript_8094/g.18858 Transcript_8094/m.18858 type:complete len:297 (-) Transcript_8094:390-1280(-)|eukprot:CAMPEP_0114129780 /NCGR_PEP_ID=MMETSP0043_2-20121206/11656_1 /TAXON_ID=464988 /ORGANISM="Hemiselmis andersenii, Strain CCMP644" /LENGTH=296 /DNA_ID=CAMNT_0001223075 /DNA_START=140 /DNA_END=1030 /DNA_ORIENTATION=+